MNSPPGEEQRPRVETEGAANSTPHADTSLADAADELMRHVDRVSTFRRRWWEQPPTGTARSAQFGKILADAKAECARRRTRVFKYPDLVEALRQPPLSMRPECWNGYIPPAFDPPRHPGGPAPRNTSIYRAGLVEICAIAFEREKAAGDA